MSSGRRAVEAEAVPAGGGDHRRVVGAHRPARQEAVQPVLVAGVEEVLAQLRVGGHAAAEGEALGADLAAARRALCTSTSTTAAWNDAATSAVSTSGCWRTWFITAVLSPEKLTSRPVVAHRPREVDRLRIAVDGDPLDRRAARVAESEEAGDLVERLTGGVVDRLAEQPVAADRRASRRASCGRPTRAARRSAARSTGRRAAPRRGGPRGG